MNVVWHHHEGVLLIVSEEVGIVLDRFHDHVCDGRLPKVELSAARFVQQPIHSGESLAGVERRRWESSVGRQSVVEAPSDENGPIRLVIVRKPATIERHTGIVRRGRRISQ